MKRTFCLAPAVMALMGLLLFAAAEAQAAALGTTGKKTFIVLPFTVQGPSEFKYLERSLPQMLTSRLYWKGRVEPLSVPASAKPALSADEARKAHTQYKADYVVWGSVNIVGADCSLDVRITDKSGTAWTGTREAKAPQLMNAITDMSNTINREVFNRTTAAAQPAPANAGAGRVNQMNPDILVNENSPKEVYLNPQFRYSGTSAEDDSRLRAPALNFSSVGMEVVDADGDGRNEIIILSEHAIRAYAFSGGQMQLVAEHKFPLTRQCLSLRALPRGGRAWLVVNMVDQKSVPQAAILTLQGKTFVEEVRNQKFFLNVVKLPPNFGPVLIGQEPAPPRVFKPGVYIMNKQGDKLVTSSRLNLPSEVNVFGFTYLPAPLNEPGADKLIALTSKEQLRTYSNKNNSMALSSEKYSGAAVGLEVNAALPGFGEDTVAQGMMFYIPMRMLATDLDRNGTWELLVNKPISAASQIFDRYRFFPQSEIHSLFWDGTGMNLQWKTRRIKGSMVDFAIADANNDGILDLVVCLNTHPGAMGVQARKTTVILYPLDISRTDPNTAPYKGDYYDD